MKHTKEKWEISLREKSNKYVIKAPESKPNSEGKRLIVCSIPFEKAWKDKYISNIGLKESEVRRTKEEALAKTKLIAAAPELLQELEYDKLAFQKILESQFGISETAKELIRLRIIALDAVIIEVKEDKI